MEELRERKRIYAEQIKVQFMKRVKPVRKLSQHKIPKLKMANDISD